MKAGKGLPDRVRRADTAEYFLHMVRSGLPDAGLRSSWALFPPLFLEPKDCQTLAEILPGSRFKLLSLAERGLNREGMQRFAKEAKSSCPDLSALVEQAPVPIYKGSVGGRAYPAFSLGLSEKGRRPLVSTGFLKCVEPTPQGQKMRHFQDSNMAHQPISALSPWTFFINNAEQR